MMYRVRRAGPVILVLIMGIATSPVRARGQSGRGLTYTMTMTSTSSSQPAPTIEMVAKMQFSSNGQVRSDVLPTGAASSSPAPTGNRPPIAVPGTYKLGRKGSDTTFIIDPTQKKYWVSVLSKTGVPNRSMKYSSFDIAAQRVQPDSSIEGIPVQHWRVTDNSTTQYTKNQSIFDVYTAPGFDIGADQVWKSAAMKMTGDAAYDAQRTAAWTQATQGLPLLMRMQMQIQVKQGNPISANMTMSASHISHGDPPASIFVFPSGYTREE